MHCKVVFWFNHLAFGVICSSVLLPELTWASPKEATSGTCLMGLAVYVYPYLPSLLISLSQNCLHTTLVIVLRGPQETHLRSTKELQLALNYSEMDGSSV